MHQQYEHLYGHLYGFLSEHIPQHLPQHLNGDTFLRTPFAITPWRAARCCCQSARRAEERTKVLVKARSDR